MALVNVQASVDLSALEVRDKTVKEAVKLMQGFSKIRAKGSTNRIRSAFSAPNSLPDLPFIWSLDPVKQKRARAYYFAVIVPNSKQSKRGRFKGRYKRTGKLERAWQVQFQPETNGGSFVASNPSDAVDYVYGDRQVPSHFLTGWEEMDRVFDYESNILIHEIINDWQLVSTGDR